MKKVGSMRRFSTGLAAAAAAGLKSGSRRSLYLCFTELHGYEKNHVVRCIGLDTSTFPGDDNTKKLPMLPVIASKIYRNDDPSPSRFTTFGSQILLPLRGSEDLFWFNTSDYPTQFHPTASKVRSFSDPKALVQMGEVDGRLYSVGVNYLKYPICVFENYNPFFEFFDPESESPPRWLTLKAPPFLNMDLGLRNNYDTRFLNESKKILGWAVGVPQVFCFDTTNPGNEWVKLDNSLLQNAIPFACLPSVLYPWLQNNAPPIASCPLFIHSHHSDIGDFYLVFIYKPAKEPGRVNLYFMSNTCDSFQPILNQPINLPDVCSAIPSEVYREYSFQFLNLGDQKVGLLINTSGGGEIGDDETSEYEYPWGKVLLVIFHYDIIVTLEDSKPNIEIRTHLLGTRCYEYEPMPMNMYKTGRARLDGAFIS